MPTSTVMQSLVDEFGELKAEIARLCEREKELKAIFIDSNLDEIDGKIFRVTVSVSERETLDTNMARQFLNHNEIQLCTRISTTTTVRCSSRRR